MHLKVMMVLLWQILINTVVPTIIIKKESVSDIQDEDFDKISSEIEGNVKKYSRKKMKLGKMKGVVMKNKEWKKKLKTKEK